MRYLVQVSCKTQAIAVKFFQIDMAEKWSYKLQNVKHTIVKNARHNALHVFAVGVAVTDA